MKSTCIIIPWNMYSGIACSVYRVREEGGYFSPHMWHNFLKPHCPSRRLPVCLFPPPLAISDTPKSESDPLSHEQERYSPLHSVTSFWPWDGGEKAGPHDVTGPQESMMTSNDSTLQLRYFLRV